MTALVWVRQYLCDPVFGINIIHVDVCVLTKAQQELNFVAFDKMLLVTQVRGQFNRDRFKIWTFCSVSSLI